MDSSTRSTVFVSYSHRDEVWKDRLVQHLQVLELEGNLEIWDDQRIVAGDEWKPAIETAMSQAQVAVLLISAAFLTSKFIRNTEVPRILRRRQKEGLRVIPLIVRPCAWQKVSWLAEIQCRPEGGRALSAGTEHQIDADFAELAEEIGGLFPAQLREIEDRATPDLGDLKNAGDMLYLCPSCFTRNEGRCSCGYRNEDDRPLICLPQHAILQKEFVIGRLLGKGSFGITYLGWDRLLERKVAIKEYLPQHLAGRDRGDPRIRWYSPQDEEDFRYGREEFVQEARIVARLHHPHIVKVLRYFEENGTAYMVMDFRIGAPLDQHFEGGAPLPAAQAIEILRPILEALSYIHREKILHLDLKPSNVYLADYRTPTLLDFGGARTALRERTRSPSMLLSPGYAPLEQYISHGLGSWSDVYAAGAILYWLLTGQKPPSATDRNNVDKLVPPARLVPGLSPRLSDVVLKALALHSENRIHDAEELSDALDAALKPAIPPRPASVSYPPLSPSALELSRREKKPPTEPLPALNPPAVRPQPAEPPPKQPHSSSLRALEQAPHRPTLARSSWSVEDLYDRFPVAGGAVLLSLLVAAILLTFWIFQPVAMPDQARARLGEEILISVLSNDRSRIWTGMRLTSVGEPSGGQARRSTNNAIIYKPAADFSGIDRFRYTMSNGWLTDATEVQVTVLAPQLGEVLRHERDGLEYAWIPPGEFQMGCSPPGDSPCDADESPARRVILKNGFWLGTTEVTVEAFARLSDSKDKSLPLNAYWAKRAKQPRPDVIWTEADAFCRKSGGRLPTEAEWEYAARGGKSHRYPWGNEKPTALKGALNGVAFDPTIGPANVGSFGANAFHLFDMAGNVWEWCQDTWHAGYRGAPSDGSAWLSEDATLRVIRGGSWKMKAKYLRTANRGVFKLNTPPADVGFRCARDTPPEPLSSEKLR